MNDEQKDRPLFSQLLRLSAYTFTVTVLAVSLAGILSSGETVAEAFAEAAQQSGFLFTPGGSGLSHGTIMQIAGFSVITAIFSTLVSRSRRISNMRFLWRAIIFMLVNLFTAALFSVVFKWFPVMDSEAWFFFTTFFVVCFLICFGLTLLVLKLEGRKYNKLLAGYKARQRNMNE